MPTAHDDDDACARANERARHGECGACVLVVCSSRAVAARRIARSEAWRRAVMRGAAVDSVLARPCAVVARRASASMDNGDAGLCAHNSCVSCVFLCLTDERSSRAWVYVERAQYSSHDVGVAFALVIFAGLSTAIGSTFVFCSSRANTSMLARALGGSAGVMIYVSFAEIFSSKSVSSFTEVCDGDAQCGWRWATLCFFSGLAFMYLLDYVVHAINDGTGCWGSKAGASGDSVGTRLAQEHAHSHSFLSIHGELDECVRDIAKMEGGGDCTHSTTAAAAVSVSGEKGTLGKRRGRKTKVRIDACDDDDDGMSMASVKVCDREPDTETMSAAPDVTVANVDLTDVHHKAIEAKKLKNMGLMTAIAIGLHNFPEGLATFVAALADPKLGGALAIAIAIHNIPEGICVAMPIYYATGSKWKGFWWSFLSGLSEPLGAVVGYAILQGNAMSDAAFGSLFGCVAGMMIFVSIKELIPTALKYDPHDVFVTNYVFVGMAIMALSLVLFYV